MIVDKSHVRKAANLARIAVPEERLETLSQELNSILNWVEQLKEVDVEGVEPLANPVEMPLPLRVDTITDGDKRDQVLANAPRSEDGFFVVPKVVE